MFEVSLKQIMPALTHRFQGFRRSQQSICFMILCQHQFLLGDGKKALKVIQNMLNLIIFATDLGKDVAIMRLPELLSEKCEHFFATERGDRCYPYVLITEQGEFIIIADNVDVATADTLPKAFQVYFAVFYIFNIAYSKQTNATLTFVQKVLLNIQDNTKKNARVVSLLAKLTEG